MKTSDLLSDQAAPGFDDPLGMLVACHRRIERQLATLARLQRHLPEFGCDAEARSAAKNILKYFDNAAFNHHADEEDSVFPRLWELSREVHSVIGELEDEHARLNERWRKLRPLLAAIAAAQGAALPPKEVADLAEMYRTHIAKEETALLPMAVEFLDAVALQTIGEEMAARRGVDPTHPVRRSA